MNGHARVCAWCGRPAVCEVEVQGAEYQTTSRTDPVNGERIADRRPVRLAITAAVCEAHRNITIGQARAVVHPRHRSARAAQLDLFSSAQHERLRDAITERLRDAISGGRGCG